MAERELPAEAWRAWRGSGFPHESWRVENGELHAVGSAERVDLVSRESFADFMLSFEWRLPAAGNSGVLYRVTEETPEPWQSGPEMQLLDDEGHPDGAEPATSCGALYALVAPQSRPQPTALAGGWRRGAIVVEGPRVEHWIDGERVLECDLFEPGLRERISHSKFGEFPQFALRSSGHIVLQHHGTDAAFRGLTIETLRPQRGS